MLWAIRKLRPWLMCLAVYSSALNADQLSYLVTGVEEPILTNVLTQVSAFRIGNSTRLNSRMRRKIIQDAKTAATKAVRPYGYFHPVVQVEMQPEEAGQWRLAVNVTPGPPVLIDELNIEVMGTGSKLDSLKEWQSSFPLRQGRRLKQPLWDQAKLDVLELLEKEGYLQAQFVRHTIHVDTQANTAKLDLLVDTGLQAVMGQVSFNQDVLDEGLLDAFQRFQTGDAYNSWLLERFRLDLWRTGYFDDIEIIERRQLTGIAPQVDLEVNLTPRKKNTYQSTVGYGTDTQIRGQFLWGRHHLSSRGDNFDVGFGWQQKDNEFSIQGNYRLPRKTNPQQFWIASARIKSEKQALEVSQDGSQESRVEIARGSINDKSLRFGKTRARNMKGGFQQLFETVYLQFLNEKQDFEAVRTIEPLAVEPLGALAADDLLLTTSNSIAVGVDWAWPEIRGNGFRTVGHHERAWIFTSNDAWGSEVEFSQIYISSRFNYLFGDKWKMLLRAEAAYSDAAVVKTLIPTAEGDLEIQVTELPKLYRFQAGGSRSVRGYAFESLDNNGLGSNHIFTASAEVEYHFHESWSAAAFVDTGNAFNDWSDPKLKLGTGIGLRWYSVIGAVRLDFAQGRNLQGEPWRIHLTIGTTLL